MTGPEESNVPENVIKTLIVDDDPKARLQIRKFLENETDIDIVGECGDGKDALDIILRQQPQLLFLDVEMPEMDGFELLEHLREADKIPMVVFVTAYDQYAIKAFEYHALDYLLKPFDKPRFTKTLTWARKKLKATDEPDIRDTVYKLLEDIRKDKEKDYLNRLVVKKDERYIFLNINQVFWIESNKNYVNINTENDTFLYRNSLSAIEARLDPARFFKINRFSIVNIDCIKEVQEMFKGDMLIILKNKTRLTIGRRNRKKLKEIMQ